MAFVSTQTSLGLVFVYSLSNQTNCICIAEYHKPHPMQKQKPTARVGLCFWWEWVDSNHLSRKTTDLQSAPALQLRRTPTSLVRAAGIEPAFQAWKACILALELCSQRIQSPLIISYFFPNASIYSRKLSC